MQEVTTRVRNASRVLVVIAMLGTLISVPAGPALAQDTAAVAVNTKDGTSLFRFAFGVKKEMDDVVDASNGAAAVSSCTDCQTLAVSIQIVLVMSDPSIVTPENVAVALNVDCTLCETGAFAYQFVISTGGPVYFTQEGLAALLDVRQALQDLGERFEAGELTLEEVDAELDAIVASVRDTLANELVTAGQPLPEATPTPDESVEIAPTTPSQTTTATPTG